MNNAPAPPLLAYRGMAYAWECDQMGHLNTRYYFSRMEEAMAAVAAALHIPGAFRAGGASTLRVTEQHGRFLKEIRDGQVMTIQAGVLEIEPAAAIFLFVFHHQDGAIAAGFTVRAEHFSFGGGGAFAWSRRAREALDGLLCSRPPEAAPRTLRFGEPARGARLDIADALGMPVHGLGAVQPEQCDAHGLMRAQFYIARFSEPYSHSLGDWRALFAAAAPKDKPRRLGRALLEHRALYRRWPAAGDGLVLRTGLIEAAEKYDTCAHWALDPLSGEAWVEMEAVRTTFDLDTRKIVSAPPSVREALNAISITDLRR